MGKGFIRIKLLEFRNGHEYEENSETHVAVNIKERNHIEGQASQLIQRRMIIYSDWNTCFDIHVYPGREINLVVMKKPNKYVSSVTVTVHELLDVCKRESMHTRAEKWLKLMPFGKIFLQVINFSKNSVGFTPVGSRKLAIKHLKDHHVYGHFFIAKIVKELICSFCNKGPLKAFNSYICQLCKCAAHKKCYDKIHEKCRGYTRDYNQTNDSVSPPKFYVNIHNFEKKNYFSYSFCFQCKTKLYDKVGLQCQCCKMNVHEMCKDKVRNYCDGNLIFLAEVLAMTGSSKRFAFSDFIPKKVLGEGSYGKVMLAQMKVDGSYKAIKVLKKKVVLADNEILCTMIERQILELGRTNPFIAHLHSTFQSPSHFFFVMEYLNGGDLRLHIEKSHVFSLLRSQFYAAEIVCGLQFLHRKGIIYRDLKLDNVLLDEDGHIKLVDFGVSWSKNNIFGKDNATSFCGTPDYIAPEILEGKEYNHSVDFWSLGVLCFEMLTGESLFNGDDEDYLFENIIHETIQYPRFLDGSTRDYLSCLLIREPKLRLGMSECKSGEIRDHDFFKNIVWMKLENRECEPPFKPNCNSENTSLFDINSNYEDPSLTPDDDRFLESIDQTLFKGFDFTSSSAEI